LIIQETTTMQAKTGNGSGAQRSAMDKQIEGYSKSAHETVDRAAEAAGRVAERIGERIESLQDKRDELMEMPMAWLDGAKEYVREKPFQALGIALAAGYLLSMLMRSKD
jgi:ElaB/YqjD/DUF883 family membrane-anchored ribosome-binding protein